MQSGDIMTSQTPRLRTFNAVCAFGEGAVEFSWQELILPPYRE